MELEDLKTVWKSMGNEIEQISKNRSEEIKPHNDVKTSLINRFRWGIVIVIVAVCLLGTSRLWAPVKMPAWWICAFCLLFISGIFATILLIKMVQRINLGEDSHVKVMERILSIKIFYRNIELYGCLIVLFLMICGVIFSPIPYRPAEIVFVSAVTFMCFIIEYMLYKSNIRKLMKMQNWLG